jgi:hypothetical protein
VVDTINRRMEAQQHERMLALQWQTRQLAVFTSAAAGVMGDTSELVRAAGDVSIFGDEEPDAQPVMPPRPRTGLEEWEHAAKAAEAGDDETGKEMAGVPAGMSFADLPEMEGVPAGGPQQREEGEVPLRGQGAQIGGAEALIGIMAGQPPGQGR